MENHTQAEEIRVTPTLTTDRMTGGETEMRAAYLALRALIQQEADVHEVLALSYIPQENRWLYLIKTPFATFPKYVVGTTDAANETPKICFSCGHEDNARREFDELNMGEHL